MIFPENTEAYLRDLATRVDDIDRIALNLLADEVATIEREIARATESTTEPVAKRHLLSLARNPSKGMGVAHD